MAKIGKEHLSINKEGVHAYFEVALEYSRSNGFFILVPEELQDKAALLEEDAFGWVTRSNASKAIIQGENEQECLFNARTGIFELLKATMSERKVIILLYEPDNNCTFGEHQYNKEHEQVGLRMGLTYAVEVEMLNTKTYFLQEGLLTSDQTSTTYAYKSGQELRIWKHGSTIIDDTPKNRDFLEGLYRSMRLLNEKLEDFTETPESLLGLIDSGTRLLKA